MQLTVGCVKTVSCTFLYALNMGLSGKLITMDQRITVAN
ncbi:hypothetical protein Nizo2726_1682 [Lactiplantibacillus plantarum]|nr:hypothetical protein GBLP1_g0347 [Lactiplantibacillus plantarum]KZU33299.1 hypothetical protein Nizo2726_1682 [Lactiplantibacillus plantarum]KZU50008.1 hypothetical protein Nizo2801_2932 [Lactiplantibacillus plantarum]